MEQTEILLPNGRNYDIVPFAHIQYIEANRKLCKVVTTKREYRVSQSLQSLEAQLPKQQFLRIHKSYIISLFYVAAIGRTELDIAGRAVPISRTRKAFLFERYTRLRSNLH